MARELHDQGKAHSKGDIPAMIQLTESAQNAIRTAIAGTGQPLEGLRIAVDAGGCAGFQYKMGLAAAPEPDDEVVETGGVKVFVDRESLPLLWGTTVDFVIGLQNSGFTFDNPQAKSSCSCGKSFG
jgi:iron-sulfur cluster assembly protein